MKINHKVFSKTVAGKLFAGTTLFYEDDQNNKATVTTVEFCVEEKEVPGAIEKAQKKALFMAREQIADAGNPLTGKKSGETETPAETPKKRKRGRPPKNRKPEPEAENPAGAGSRLETEIDQLLNEFDTPEVADNPALEAENPALDVVFKTIEEADPKIRQYDGKTLKEILEIYNGFLDVVLSDYYRPMVTDEVLRAVEELKKGGYDAS